MNNHANSSTFPRPVIPLREFARRYLASHPKPDIGDVLPALEAMGHSRELIEACFEAEKAARASASEKAAEVRRWAGVGEQAAALPELEETIEGLEKALELAGIEIRWNTRGGWVECRMVGGEEWIECAGVTLDDTMVRCSQVARLRVGRGTIPWKIRNRKDEARGLGFAARKRPEAGEANAVHEAVLEWALSVEGGAYILTQALDKGGGLNRYERGSRAPRWVERSAKAALREAGWTYKSVRGPRGPRGPRNRWVPPGRPRKVKLAPSTYAKDRHVVV